MIKKPQSRFRAIAERIIDAIFPFVLLGLLMALVTVHYLAVALIARIVLLASVSNCVFIPGFSLLRWFLVLWWLRPLCGIMFPNSAWPALRRPQTHLW
jgi:hypothetical protein